MAGKVFEILEKEYNRQLNTVELIASENFVSNAILNALGSVFTNKYTEGYPPVRYQDRGVKGRYYGGCENYDELEEYCCAKWREVFNTEYHVNVQPHSGSSANMAAYAAFLDPGDTILGMSLDAGGHLTHSAHVSFVGHTYNVITYGVDENGYLNVEEIRDKIITHLPKLVVLGASAYSREFNFNELYSLIREAAQASGDNHYMPIIMVDMAHIAGLVATGFHPSPFGMADVITTTTHKTLRGPRGGLIFCKPQYAEKIDKAVFPYCQGGSLMNVIAAKAVCAEEALTYNYKQYIQQVVNNCAAMANKFISLGYNIISGGTDNHLFLLDLRGTYVTGKELQEACDKEGITLNKNAIPNDPLPTSLTSGVRIGTAAMTTKGYDANDFCNVAIRIHNIIQRLSANNQPIAQYDPNSITIGEYPLDPNIYRDVEMWKNVTVIVSENIETGEMQVSWKRQEDTENISDQLEEE